MILEVQHWCSVVLHFESPAIQKYLARKYRFVSPPKLTLNIYEVYVPGIYIVQKITPGITIPLPTTAVDFVTNFTEKKHTHTKGDSGENGVIAVLSSQMVEQLHQPEYIYICPKRAASMIARLYLLFWHTTRNRTPIYGLKQERRFRLEFLFQIGYVLPGTLTTSVRRLPNFFVSCKFQLAFFTVLVLLLFYSLIIGDLYVLRLRTPRFSSGCLMRIFRNALSSTFSESWEKEVCTLGQIHVSQSPAISWVSRLY